MTVRVAQASDYMTVFKFCVALHKHECGKEASAQKLCGLMSEVAGAFKDDDGPTILLAERDGKPVGMVWMMCKPPFSDVDGKTIRVDVLWIEPEYRKTTVLAELWEAWNSIAESYNFEKIQCVVRADNEDSLRIWKKRGAVVHAYILERDCGIKRKRRSRVQDAVLEASGQNAEGNYCGHSG